MGHYLAHVFEKGKTWRMISKGLTRIGLIVNPIAGMGGRARAGHSCRGKDPFSGFCPDV